MSSRSTPPFRAEHVGSLLRSQAVLDARQKFESKQFSAGELRRVEDDAVRHVIKRQEDAGLQCVTDGELRRGTWHMDFLCRIGGVIPGGTQISGNHRSAWVASGGYDMVAEAVFNELEVDGLFLESTMPVPERSSRFDSCRRAR